MTDEVDWPRIDASDQPAADNNPTSSGPPGHLPLGGEGIGAASNRYRPTHSGQQRNRKAKKDKYMKILIINGPNLNLLGLRQPEVYGNRSYSELCQYITDCADAIGVQAEIRQTNHEGVLVDWIQAARGVFDGIVLNPAAYTHTSVALLDAVKAVGLPTVEVHLSDPDRREPFRQVSYLRQACVRTIVGNGVAGYLEALDFLTL